MAPERLPRPADETLEPSLWIDEAIWGHRLYDEQVPWLALLEMLGILRETARDGQAFRETAELNRLSYRARHALFLRNIVFNNPGLATIGSRAPDDRARWALWRGEMRATSSGLRGAEYDYLEERFDSFDDFVSLIQLLRATAIEGSSNKRWTSKFIFPYGPDCLYEDLRLDEDGGASNDRRFFARTGELLYLMLCRSGRGEELLARLAPLFLSKESRWNRLVAVLEPGGEVGAGVARSSAFLPYQTLPDFESLAQDWLALLNVKLPGYDVLPHLVDLLGLHLMLYFLRRAADWVRPNSVRLVVEIVAPKRSTVRDLATDTFQRNNLLSKLAVDRFIDDEIVANPQWAGACSSNDPFGEAMAFILGKVAWRALRGGGAEYTGARSPAALLEELRKTAQRRHGQHLANFHSSYARAIGLASKRGTRGVRYAPNDQLLKSLVFAVVPRRMEFQQFLETLYGRYSLIIGHRQANDLIGADSDRRAFEENARRLEMRLGSLGLLRRLSDACAYVENPFGGTL
jgi:hypothetical protein